MPKDKVTSKGGKTAAPDSAKKAVITNLLKSKTAAPAKQKKKTVNARAVAARQHKSNNKKVTTGFEALGDVCQNDDLEELNAFYRREENRALLGYNLSLIRNGHLHRSFYARKTSNATAASLGTRIFADGQDKFRHISGTQAVEFLANLLSRDEIRSWFRGEEKLELAVAQKMLRFGLGVSESTTAPQNHEHWQYEAPLLWIFKSQWAANGNRLQGVTKETADSSSDYFCLSEAGTEVLAPFSANKVVEVPLKMEEAQDWCIVNGWAFDKATLVSESQGVEMGLARAWLKKQEAPNFDTFFDFPERTEENATELTFVPVPATPPATHINASPVSAASSPLVPLPTGASLTRTN